ncbi:hypothetical protein BD779DRAFT_1680806 [Infundibulicybe gibba]|nr:hypothetical protein BD779DRAFT_1680806 [Infundibulicybe gibba]
MEQEYIAIDATASSPFRVEALHYTPEVSYDDGITFILLHAMNLHKETYHVLLKHLLGSRSSPPALRIKDAWCIENPTTDVVQSSTKSSYPRQNTREDVRTSLDYAKAIHSFLGSTAHGVDFRTRKLIAIAHSGGSTSLMMLQTLEPKFPFKAFVFLDPAILPPTLPSSKVLTTMFGGWAASKKDTWPSRADAFAELSGHPAYKRWDPELIKLFVENALRPLDSSGAVTLACSKIHESTYYDSPDALAPPGEIYISIAKEDAIPMHVIMAKKDEYRGKTDEMKQFQAEHAQKMKDGSVQWLDRGGHMFPQVEPVLAARSIEKALLGISAVMSKL